MSTLASPCSHLSGPLYTFSPLFSHACSSSNHLDPHLSCLWFIPYTSHSKPCATPCTLRSVLHTRAVTPQFVKRPGEPPQTQGAGCPPAPMVEALWDTPGRGQGGTGASGWGINIPMVPLGFFMGVVVLPGFPDLSFFLCAPLFVCN